MAHRLAHVAALACVLAGGSSAADPAEAAFPSQAGTRTIRVTFEQVSSNCKDAGMKLAVASVSVTQRGTNITVSVPGVPAMKGKVRNGKFQAKVGKGPTEVPGVTGRFSAGGRLSGKSIRFLFIGEYYRSDKPVCTQSWNAKSS